MNEVSLPALVDVPATGKLAAGRHGRRDEPQHLCPPCGPGADDQHRADGQCLAGDDPYRGGKDGPHAHLSCL